MYGKMESASGNQQLASTAPEAPLTPFESAVNAYGHASDVTVSLIEQLEHRLHSVLQPVMPSADECSPEKSQSRLKSPLVTTLESMTERKMWENARLRALLDCLDV